MESKEVEVNKKLGSPSAEGLSQLDIYRSSPSWGRLARLAQPNHSAMAGSGPWPAAPLTTEKAKLGSGASTGCMAAQGNRNKGE